VRWSAGPSVVEDDLVKQTHDYVVASGVLGIGYVLAMFAASVAFVNHLAGLMVALNRHVRALKSGRYASRVTLRGSGGVHAELAQDLNELAVALEEHEQTERAA
jgi:signal transduction histidine kinase